MAQYFSTVSHVPINIQPLENKGSLILQVWGIGILDSSLGDKRYTLVYQKPHYFEP